MHRVGQKRARRLAGEAFWVALGMGLSTLAGFVGVRLLTTVLPPGEYGRLALAMSVTMTLRYSFGAALRTSAARFFSVASQRGLRRWYARLLGRLVFVTAGAGAICSLLAFGVFTQTGFAADARLFAPALLLGALAVISSVGTGVLSGARDRRAVCLTQNLFQWGRFVLAFLAVIWLGASAEQALAGFVAAALLTPLVQLVRVRRRLRPIADCPGAGPTGEFMRYVLPLLFSGLFVWLQMFSVRWAIRYAGSLADVGSYFAYYQIGFMPILIGSGFLISFLNPIFFGHAGDGSDGHARQRVQRLNGRISLGMLATVLAAFVAAWLLKPLAAAVLVAPAYRSGVWMLPWLVLTGGLYATARQFLVSAYSGMESTAVLPATAAGGLLALALYFGGGRLAGLPGIIGGGVCFSVLFAALAAGVHRRTLRRSMPAKQEALR